MSVEQSAVKAVVFDLYNTLVSAPQGTSIFRDFFLRLGFDAAEYPSLRRLIMTQNLATLEEIANELKPELEIDSTDFQRRLDERIGMVAVYPETIAVLEELKRRGLKIGLISNLSQPFSRPFLDFGLNKYFDQAVFSFEAGFVKPQPEIYRMMIDRLDIEPNQILMTGDKFSKDVEAPRLAGMQAVHLDRSGKSPDSIQTLKGIFQYL